MVFTERRLISCLRRRTQFNVFKCLFFIKGILIFSFFSSLLLSRNQEEDNVGHLRIVHITDLHIDPEMSEEADLNPFPPMRTPIVLLESALVYLREIEPDPFAIIITGDFVNRAFVSGELGTREATKITETRTLQGIKAAADLLRQYFPSTLKLPLVGNHDIKHFVSPNPYRLCLESGGLDSLMPSFMAAETFAECGFYSAEKEGVKFIAYNTVIYSERPSTSDSGDPCSQFRWLDSELLKSPKSPTGDVGATFLLGHSAPGLTDTRPWIEKTRAIPSLADKTAQSRLTSLLYHHRLRISAHFYGDLHRNSLRKPCDGGGGQECAPAFVQASMASTGVNPSFRIYSLKSGEFSLADYRVYFLPLGDIDTRQFHHGGGKQELLAQLVASWRAGERATDIFETRNLSAEEMARAVDRMAESFAAGNEELLQKYNEHRIVKWMPKKAQPCDEACKWTVICSMTAMTKEELTHCVSRNHPESLDV